ncbi:MAG TPA: hypothetical protein VLC98_04045 [Phnomibacter sp.]|nr:hypothetical protein [Phnomibacter sp.]
MPFLKTFLLILTTSIFYNFSFGQKFSSGRIDSITKVIDRDTSLKVSTITLDTLYVYNGTPIKVEVTFTAVTDIKTNRLKKVIWNNPGEYYSFVTLYYNKNGAIKGLINIKHKATDTNPENESNSIFYYSGEKVLKEIVLSTTNNNYHTNGYWYMSTVNGFIKLAGLKF